jgi:DNA polymerase III subunit gamma/tau
MAYIPLHHKYRPQTFADLVGQEAIATTLSNALRLQKIAPAYLFTGPRGTGKTSSARILAKSLNCMASAVPTAQPCGSCDVCRSIAAGAALDIIEIDAASNTGVDNIREIIERAQYAPVQCRYKVYIIDECHMLTTAAFNSLLKTLEEPPPHVVFILATTDPQRVLPTIISRCQRFDYRRIPVAAMVGHLTYIAQAEQIEIPVASITLISQIAQGGLRDAESLLDRLSLLSGDITPDRVWDAIGSVPEQDLLEILQSIASNDPESLLDRARNILERGKEPLTVLQNLAGCYRDLLIAKTAPQRPDLVALSPETWTELGKIAKAWQISWILAGQKHLKDSEIQIKQTTQPQLWLEITLLGLLSVSTQPVAASPAPQPVATPTPLVPPPAIVQPAPVQSSANVAAVPTPPQPLPPQPRPEAAPNPTPPPATGNTDLTATWEKVLQQLLPASKDLFKVFGTLISVTTEQAVVAMKSSTMQQIASGKVPELTKVFSSIFGRSIVVKLEVLGKIQPQAAASSAPVASTPAPVTIAPTPPAPPPEMTAPVAIEPTAPEIPSHPPQLTIPAPTEYLTDEEEDEEEETTASAELEPFSPQISDPVASIQPPALPIVSLQPAPSPEPPAAKLEPSVPLLVEVELDPPDFDEPPESFDVDRAAQIETNELDESAIDPALQAATDNVVKLFNGEIIDRQHDLYAKLVGE